MIKKLKFKILIDTDQSIVVTRGKAGWGGSNVVKDKGGPIYVDGRRFDFRWWTHNAIYRWCTIELYTWNLYNVIDQCHPNKFDKIKIKWPPKHSSEVLSGVPKCKGCDAPSEENTCII